LFIFVSSSSWIEDNVEVKDGECQHRKNVDNCIFPNPPSLCTSSGSTFSYDEYDCQSVNSLSHELKEGEGRGTMAAKIFNTKSLRSVKRKK